FVPPVRAATEGRSPGVELDPRRTMLTCGVLPSLNVVEPDDLSVDAKDPLGDSMPGGRREATDQRARPVKCLNQQQERVCAARAMLQPSLHMGGLSCRRLPLMEQAAPARDPPPPKKIVGRGVGSQSPGTAALGSHELPVRDSRARALRVEISA